MPFMQDRARELYSLLVRFVKENDIPLASHADNVGGIVLGGWSFAAGWMTALLANVATFPVNDVELGAYMRRIILHGTALLFYELIYGLMAAAPDSSLLQTLRTTSSGTLLRRTTHTTPSSTTRFRRRR